MGSRYEVEVTVISGKNLKNVNWRNGNLRPYAVLWVDPATKCSTKVAVDGDSDDPLWDVKLTVPLGPNLRIDDAVLSIDVVHASNAGEKDTKPLVGSARIPLREIADEVGIGGGRAFKTLKLKRPSGRPHGKIDVKISIRELSRYYDAPPPPGTGSYGNKSREYTYGGGGGYAPYGAPPPSGYPYAAAPPPSGYPYGGAVPPPVAYGQGPVYGQSSSYGQQQPASYGQPPQYAAAAEKKSKFGMGTGLAVGAVGGLLGGLAIAEGVDYMENKIADKAADRVEDDLGYDDGDYGGDDF